MILGMDSGVEWNLVINVRARLWKSGEHGEWHSFASSKEDFNGNHGGVRRAVRNDPQ